MVVGRGSGGKKIKLLQELASRAFDGDGEFVATALDVPREAAMAEVSSGAPEAKPKLV